MSQTIADDFLKRDVSNAYFVFHLTVVSILTVLCFTQVVWFIRFTHLDKNQKQGISSSRFFWLLILAHLFYPINVGFQSYQILNNNPVIVLSYWMINISQGVLVISYVHVLFKRTYGILKQTKFYTPLKYLTYACTFMFLVSMINPFLYSVCNYQPIKTCRPAANYLTIWLIMSSLSLFLIEIIFGYLLFRYVQTSKSINSPNAEIFSVLANFGLWCTLFAFLAALTSLFSLFTNSQTLIAIGFLIYHFFILMVLTSLVVMKYKIIQMRKGSQVKNTELYSANSRITQATSVIKGQDLPTLYNTSETGHTQSTIQESA